MLSGGTSRHTSVTDSFDRESFNSVEQTFTVVVVSFMVAHTESAESAEEIRIRVPCVLICLSAVVLGEG